MIYRHKKRGTKYRILQDYATVQCSTGPLQDGEIVLLYIDIHSKKVYARRPDEFFDGRFEEVND